eukprot:7081535-Alexandrium_andersonii.AAC.1
MLAARDLRPHTWGHLPVRATPGEAPAWHGADVPHGADAADPALAGSTSLNRMLMPAVRGPRLPASGHLPVCVTLGKLHRSGQTA